jgi:ferritin-like metal-binding protein YciE
MMAIKDAKDLFLTLLSDVRSKTERASRFYEEADRHVQDADIADALKARALISEQALIKLDRCFLLMNEKPLEVSERLQEVFLEEFRREVSEIESPVARQLFVLAKINLMTHFRIGEYMVLTAASDMIGNYAFGLLIESCLADNLAFAERTKRLIRTIIETKASQELAA